MKEYCMNGLYPVFRDGGRLYQNIAGQPKRVAFKTIDAYGHVFYFTGDEPILLDDGWALPCQHKGEKRHIKTMSGDRTAYAGQDQWRQSKQIVFYDK